MSRRITVAIAGMVIGTMLLAGFGTIVASRVGGKAREITLLERRAEGIAELVPNLQRAQGATSDTALTEARDKLVRVLGLSGVAQLRIGPLGRIIGERPAWIPVDDFNVEALRSGQTLSGSRGNRIWAAAGRTNPNGSATVTIVTATREPIIAPALRWLALSAVISLMLGIVVSVWLGRRLARPVRDAVAVTGRIAGGDLSARLAERTDPGDELGALAHSINDMATQLERSRALEHQFLMSVSHDLRTPLTSIRGYAEALADGVADPATSGGIIVEESLRLERLVADLLDLAKLDARQFGFRTRDTIIGPVVRAAVARIAPEAEALGLDVRVAVDIDPVLRVDPDRLAQVIGNLTSNSLKFARTAVWIRARSMGDGVGRSGVAVDVADDGPGIDADDLPHVFERLYQARSRVVARESGSGLGLAIVKELVEGMGGTVDVASVRGAGTTFTVWFPTVTA